MTFRLSQEEYEHLRAVSEARGARSVSEFVRAGVGWIVENCERRLWEVLLTSGQRAMPRVTGSRRALGMEEADDKTRYDGPRLWDAK